MCENAENKCKCNQKENKRLRKEFTSDQKKTLEGEFTNEHYPDFSTVERIAFQIGLTEKCVQVKIISRYHVDQRWATFLVGGPDSLKKKLCGPH